jgi:hypothetical protein
MDGRYAVLDDAARLARGYVDSLPARRVGPGAELAELRSRLRRPLTDGGEDRADSGWSASAATTG